jgi:hypothetical protein
MTKEQTEALRQMMVRMTSVEPDTDDLHREFVMLLEILTGLRADEEYMKANSHR